MITGTLSRRKKSILPGSFWYSLLEQQKSSPDKSDEL
jgi:hypothetical protein